MGINRLGQGAEDISMTIEVVSMRAEDISMTVEVVSMRAEVVSMRAEGKSSVKEYTSTRAAVTSMSVAVTSMRAAVVRPLPSPHLGVSLTLPAARCRIHKLIVSFKRDLYMGLLEEFKNHLK
jgi:hypothetical protein